MTLTPRLKSTIESTLYAVLFAAGLAFAFTLTGCQNMPKVRAGGASEIHTMTSYPLIFKAKGDALGISKVPTADGTDIYKASDLMLGLTILGFESNTTYKDAMLEVERKPVAAK